MRPLTALTAARKQLRGLTLTSPYTGATVTAAALHIAGGHVEVETTDGRRFLVDRQTKVRKP